MSRIKLSWDIADKVNFACHQNSFAVLRRVSLENADNDSALAAVAVTLESNPPFIKKKTWLVDQVAAGGTVSLEDLDVALDGQFLRGLAEAIAGDVSIKVTSGDDLVHEESKRVELLALNEWGGSTFMPELLACFSTPNQQVVDKILRAASLKLREAGRPDNLDGYQSRERERVWEITSAIYAAIADLGLSYSDPPASFEKNGQKIRTADAVVAGKVATCLDSTMLFCSALEQAGLHPIVAMPEKHAVIGVWLQPSEIASIVIDEAEPLRKRIEMKQVVLIETTYVTRNPAPSFTQALKEGSKWLAKENDDTYVAAVDIHSARSHHIKPIALDAGDDAKQVSAEEAGEAITHSLEKAPELPDFETEVAEPEPTTPAGRLERWQRKLLELTTRNPLISHKLNKASLKLICPDPALLEDKLADGKVLTLVSAQKPAQDDLIHKSRTGANLSEEFAREALEKKKLLVDLDKKDLDRHAVEIYRKANTSLQEGGTNTLFLAIGFLHWKRDKDDRIHRAPLILQPVQLTRKTARSEVKLAIHDDEPRFNTTLLEKLKQEDDIDITGLDGELPTDESGIDVKGVWNKVRRAVLNVEGFEVVEDVALGHFSFAKYLMWKDLKDRIEALKQNEVVRHLVDKHEESYHDGVGGVEGSEVDSKYAPADLIAPLSADSSQMAALANADRGRNFIIIGPPGTGKSQTIANMIVHLLGNDKTVLFVSEKTAALDVVYRRLEQIGVGNFCLELHSNKASKADVIKQLNRAWESSKQLDQEKWKRTITQLEETRDSLNETVDNLHKKHENGMSAYQAMGVKVRNESDASPFRLSWPDAATHTSEDLDKMREAVEQLSLHSKYVGGLFKKLEVISNSDWSNRWQHELLDAAAQLEQATSTATEALQKLEKRLAIGLPDQNLERLESFSKLAMALKYSYGTQLHETVGENGKEMLAALDQAIASLNSIRSLREKLSCSYREGAWLALDGDEIAEEWNKAESAWALLSILKKYLLARKIKPYTSGEKPDPAQDGPLLADLRKEEKTIKSLVSRLEVLREWQDKDPESLERFRSAGQMLRSAVAGIAEDPASSADYNAKICFHLSEINEHSAQDAKDSIEGTGYIEAFDKLGQAIDKFNKLSGTSLREMLSDEHRPLEKLSELARTVESHKSHLHDWCKWRGASHQAAELDLMPVVAAIESGAVASDQLKEAYEFAYCSWWSAKVIDEDSTIRGFSKHEHINKIGKFQQLDSDYQNLAAEYVAAKLSGKVAAKKGSKGKDWSLIRRLVKQTRPRKHIRQMITEAAEPFSVLAPCMMMSPLSVAQYLPPDQQLFDVVIFDEASQITVWDAVGSIARGKQTIVAGDPKQMPPTNFFARGIDDQDDEDLQFEPDQESILEELSSAGLPVTGLNLHYRSKYESLIAFSNHHYYGDRLVTFPAPIHPDKAVSLVKCDGFYAKGGARHNEGEAKAIVKEVVKRLTSDDQSIREQTIGIVTFNMAQQQLINDLMDKARQDHPEIEWAFSDEKDEAVFVKNLESVQGDERDVILFSIAFGPDRSGKVSMNFGPLNRDGGERRLNVALTRSRSEMVVFATISPEQIDLTRTGALAVRDLKNFLIYAEKGTSTLGREDQGSVGDYESPFEIGVAQALEAKGWRLIPQIGVSSFRIDIGVVHPDYPGVFLAGVECDGATYHSSANARERDKIRAEFLKGLGWTLVRVWSTDWWHSKARALDELHEQLQELLKEDRRKREQSNEGEASPEQERATVAV